MVVEPMRDRRAERREATKAEILDAAWELVRAEGLAALSLRDLAARVGMRDDGESCRPGRSGAEKGEPIAVCRVNEYTQEYRNVNTCYRI